MNERVVQPFKMCVLLLAVSLSGCVTMQGGSSASSPFLKSLGLDASGISDAFSTQMREIKVLVGDGKMAQAEDYFRAEQEYFVKRLQESSSPPPEEISLLGEHVWSTRYRARLAAATAELAAVKSVSERATWSEVSGSIVSAERVLGQIDQDALVNSLLLGRAEQEALRDQVKRVVSLAEAQKAAALEVTFEDLLSAGRHESTYIAHLQFDVEDYRRSPKFQELVLERLGQIGERDALLGEAEKLSAYLNPETRELVDQRFAASLRSDLMADGRISLDELTSLAGVRTPFGGAVAAISEFATVGYVDLTAASFKDRNIFDFEVAFSKDLPLAFSPADESVFRSADISRYDYLFVTDLAVAKIEREFKGKKELKSRAQTGTREVQNPDYVAAMTNYQRAMAGYQRAQISSAIPRACSGWGCALQGLADGIGQATARKEVEQASAALASTSQTVSVPVYSEYRYQSVDISARKTADVNYYVIDVKGNKVIKNNFQLNESESFNVAYNLRDEDPDKSSILRNVTSEDEVSAWEKKPMTVRLSALFNADNLKSATSTPYTDVQSFLATLSSRTYASAGPTYARGVAESQRGSSSESIADDRFDSIVIIRNPKASGTGFYVTPELVLTAYHVVEGSALVEMTFYDGTKSYGRVVDHDVRLDLALIRAQTAGKPLRIHSGPLRLGETVEAIGHPKGYEFTITRGVISAVRKQRSAVIGSDALVEFIQTDTPISPGNSGGPLLAKDVVVGVNDWIRVDKGSQNLNFSVSYNEVRAFLDRFMGR